MNGNQQKGSIWIVLIGSFFGIVLVLGVNSFFGRRNQVGQSKNQIFLSNPNSEQFTLDELHRQKQALIQQLTLIEAAISSKLPKNDTSRKDEVILPQKDLSSPINTTINSNNQLKATTTTHNPSIPSVPQIASPIVLTDNKLPAMPSSPQVKRCKYSFKVFVYPIPPHLGALRISEEARKNGSLHICRKCILEQFSLEYIVLDYFEKFCGRTMNPDEADYFYLPLVRDAEYRYAMQIGGVRSRAPSVAEQALLEILEKNHSTIWRQAFNITDYYWHKHKGGNHIIVMPAPVTNLRHESSRRGFFHYMIHLKPPIFIALEYSKSFVDEYPVCATAKNIVAPYPSTDPDLYNGKLMEYSIERDSLLYYAGGLHGDCIEVRTAMRNLMANSTKLSKVVPPVKRNMREREHGFLGAVFCPIPIGDSPSSKRMYDVLNFGCIPVVLSDDLVWAFSDQTGGFLNHSAFSIQIPQSVVQYHMDHSLRRYKPNPEKFGHLPSGKLIYEILLESKKADPDYENGIYVNPLVRILRRIPQADIDFLRKNGEEAAKHYRYYQMNKRMEMIPTSHHFFPDGGAMDMIAEELEERKKQGTVNIFEKCRQELNQKHNYVHRYPCEAEKKESLIRKRRMRRL